MMRDRLIELIRGARKTTKNANCDLEREGLIADYLLANGVIVPPCKIGDKVFYPSYYGSGILEGEILRIVIKEKGILCETEYKKLEAEEFGKSVFFTRAEAEKALEEKKKSEESEGE